MTVPLAASIVDLVLGLKLGSFGKAASNRCQLEGVAFESKPDGAIELGIRKLEVAALRLALGPLVLEIGQIAVHKLVAHVQTVAGVPRLSAIEAVDAELSDVKLHGPLKASPRLKEVLDALGPAEAAAIADTAAGDAAANAWCLAPLAAAAGTIRGEITDAHLLFDAEVTVPIRQGQIDFNDATVEHVGPDSRMGVSRLGLYVDAPNGRSYLYQFPSAPLAGVEFERRGALLTPWVSERGKLQLQAFTEALLRQAQGGQKHDLTQQARLLLDRTALSGGLQLSDGLFAVPGVQAYLQGAGEDHNAIRLSSEAVGRGLTVELASLHARDAVARWGRSHVSCDKIAADLKLQLFVEGTKVRFVLNLANGKVAGLRARPPSKTG